MKDCQYVGAYFELKPSGFMTPDALLNWDNYIGEKPANNHVAELFVSLESVLLTLLSGKVLLANAY